MLTHFAISLFMSICILSLIYQENFQFFEFKAISFEKSGAIVIRIFYSSDFFFARV